VSGLPTNKTPKRESLSSLVVLVYGPPKIGKSTWCSHAPKALFLATEEGLNHLECFQIRVLGWDGIPLRVNEKDGVTEGGFLEIYKELAKGEHDYKTIIIDTVDNLHKMCADVVRQRLKVDHESDAKYGKGYALINDKLSAALRHFAQLPCGLVMTSHSKLTEEKTRVGTINRTVPTLSDSTRKVVVGLSDMILFFDTEPRLNPEYVEGSGDAKFLRDKVTNEILLDRVIRTKPHPAHEAGDRTGKLPHIIPMDFGAFMKCFGVEPQKEKEKVPEKTKGAK